MIRFTELKDSPRSHGIYRKWRRVYLGGQEEEVWYMMREYGALTFCTSVLIRPHSYSNFAYVYIVKGKEPAMMGERGF